jgi:DNA-binding SARP family transcriptional activator
MSPCTMNTYRMEPTADGFRVTETSADGRDIVIREFRTEAAAQMWIVRRATVANMADLAKWLWESAPKSTDDE